MSRKGNIIIFILLLLLCVSANSSHPPADPAQTLFQLLADDEQKFHRLIESHRIEDKVMGLSIGVFNRQGLLWAKGYGFINSEKNIPADALSVYRVGSISKPITATAIMRMEDNNVIDIDQPIEMYLDRFLIKSRFSSEAPVTARNLITHHSGLPTNINKGLWSDTDFTSVIEQLRSEFTAYPADYVHSYSNVGYSILGCLIEEITQQDYETYIHDALFQPLGMHYSTFDPDSLPEQIKSKGYKDGVAQELLPIRDKPAMGLYSSVLDLGRFMVMLLRDGQYRNKQILSNATATELMDRQNTEVDLDFDFEMGLGFFLNRTINLEGAPTLEHGGNTMNFGAYMMINPHADIAIVVLANTHGSRSTARNLSRDIFDLIVDKDLRVVTDDHPHPPVEDKSYPESLPDKATYTTRTGLISISTEQDELCACSQRKTLDLVPLPDGWYGVYDDNAKGINAQPLLKISRMMVDGENVVVMEKDGKQTRFGAVMPSDPTPKIWQQRTGNFRVINEDPGYPVTNVRIMELDNQLFLHYRMPRLTQLAMQIPITPISDTEAITVGIGQSRGETIRVINIDHQEHLLFSGFILKPTGR